jgi:SAM-dependent methyltransferase
MTASPTVQAAPAHFALLDLIEGSMVTQAIYVAAQLGLADVLADEPLTVEEIARRVRTDPDATYRLLRLLASHSIFSEQDDGRFTMTPMAHALRPDGPNSLYGMAVLMGHPIHWEDWGHLVDSVRTGEPIMPKLRGMGAFEYLAANPEYSALFMRGMGDLSSLETEPVLTGYDFSRYGTIVDVGGGGGALLAAILQRAPRSRGVIFDDRARMFGAEAVLADAGVADRCTIADGGLFDPVTPGGDAYLLKHIVHDWPEDRALAILKNVRDAVNPDGRLLLMEFVVPEDNEPHPGKLVDLWLMLLVGGKERTERQYAELLAAAGFELVRVTPTASPLSIVEARPR